MGQNYNCGCGCGAKEDTARRAATLKFLRSELLYDIANSAYVTADTADGDGGHPSHLIADIAEDGNVDRATRVLNLAFAELSEMLYPYTKESVTDGTEDDDKLTGAGEYTLTLSLPASFSATTLRLIKELAHEYLVCRVLHDWLSVTSPDNAETWAAKAADTAEKLRSALVSRVKAFRRKMKPF